MVLEQLMPAGWLERKSSFAFFLGSFYALIGIIIAKVLFPADPSLVAIAFTSILLLPVMRKIFSLEERQEKAEHRFSLRALLRDEGDFVRTYLLIAFGVFTMYVLASMLLPGFEVSSLFREQLEFRSSSVVAGDASSFSGAFFVILLNNWWVLLACFLLSLFTGDGAVFLITWNASLWGTVFGVVARNAASFTQGNPWWFLLLVLLTVLPHALIEMLSYIFGGIAGGLISADVELDKGERRQGRFRAVFYSFVGSLLLAALVALVLGALVESLVLQHAHWYADIVAYSILV